MGLKLLVTGGYFDEGADGVIHHVELDGGRVETWARWRPPPELAVAGKGFAGARRDAERLWVAAHAAVVRWDLRSASVDGILHQPDFNDLHDVALAPGDGELLVANTGCDAIDRFTLDGVFRGRHGWLPAWAEARRMRGEAVADLDAVCEVGWSGRAPSWTPTAIDDSYHSPAAERERAPFCRTKVRDRVHPNSLFEHGGEWFATCLYDGSLRPLASMRARLKIPGHPHDGVVDGEELWLTTIDGGIWRAPLPLGVGAAERVAEAFGPGRVGWCRGLLLTDSLIVVGLTEVRPDRLPRHRWAEADPRDSVTGVVVLERGDFRELGFVDLTVRGRHHKIYSIVEVE